MLDDHTKTDDHTSTGLSAQEAADMGAGELIAHVLGRYHEIHRAEFPQMVALARKVEAVHAEDPQRPQGLADHLALTWNDLEQHQLKEEQILFPMMLHSPGPQIQFPIARMKAEHCEVEGQLVTLKTLTNAFSPPADACGSWRALYQGCRKIHEDLSRHMQLENDELFARFVR